MKCAWEPIEELLKDAAARDIIYSITSELLPPFPDWELAVDLEKKAALEKVGAYRVWVARVDGAIAGYIEFQITPHLNYKTTLFAFDQGHYLTPSYRGKGLLGVKMWRSACDALKEMGVKVVIAHDNSRHSLNSFFARLGFSWRGSMYSKVL